MSSADHYRSKALTCSAQARTATNPKRAQELKHRARSFTELAQNEQWLADNRQNTIHSPGQHHGG